jgi:hypothetical protein
MCLFVHMMKVYIFFYCHFAEFVWREVHFTFGIEEPTSINHMFTNWLLGLGRKRRKLLLVGVSAICWAIWISRNDIFLINLQ